MEKAVLEGGEINVAVRRYSRRQRRLTGIGDPGGRIKRHRDRGEGNRYRVEPPRAAA